MRTLCLLLSIFVSFGKASACLNGETKVLSSGIYLYEYREGIVPYGHIYSNDESLQEDLVILDSLYRKTKDLAYLSDKGLLLILLKRYEEAINLYLYIELLESNKYATASNIGTAYELFGQDDEALKWIKKAVAIDPKSHESSEWLHVKILEAKINGAAYYTTSFLLNTDFGEATLPHTTLSAKQLDTLLSTLYFQLNERVSFIAPQDKIVAQLMFDMGNVAFLLGKTREALLIYKQAKMYGYSGKLFDNRFTAVKRSAETFYVQVSEKGSRVNYTIISIITLVALIGVFVIWKWKFASR